MFIGGGKSAGTGAISTDNGTVTVDLTHSAVDTRTLGLKGMQVVAGSVDISPYGTHKVSDIVADTTNNQNQAGYAEILVLGAGFSDSSKIKLSVNLAGVTDVTTLAAAVNAAIQNASAGNTQAATAFKNAGHRGGRTFGRGDFAAVVVHVERERVSDRGGRPDGECAAGEFQRRHDGCGCGDDDGRRNTAAATTGFTPAGVTVRISGGGLSAAQDITFDAASTPWIRRSSI